MNTNVKNYIKKAIGPFLRDATLQVPTLFSPQTAGSSYSYYYDDYYSTVNDVCNELGFELEAFNCSRGDAGEFKRTVDSLVNHRRPTVLYLQSVDKSNPALLNRINSYINVAPIHVKVVMNKKGEIPDDSKNKTVPKKCICDWQVVSNLGCKCGGI